MFHIFKRGKNHRSDLKNHVNGKIVFNEKTSSKKMIVLELNSFVGEKSLFFWWQ